MTTAVGLQTVFGTGVESTYGTPVVADRWYEILSESLRRQQNVVASNGIRAGTRNLRRGSRRALTHRWGEGSVELEVASVGFSRWFEHMLGGTPTVVQQGATAAWLHTHEMGSLSGKALTIQKGLRDSAGAEIESFTFHGCKIPSWAFAVAVGEILTLTLDIDAEDVDTATALAAHNYATTNVFHFAQGDVRKDGVTIAKVLSAAVEGDNALKTDSWYIGTAGLKGEPEPTDFPTVEGALSLEFDDPASVYDVYAADTGVEFILEFTGPVIESPNNELVRITVPEIHFTGDTPQVSGPEVVVYDAPFEGAYDGTNPGVRIEYQSTDSAV